MAEEYESFDFGFSLVGADEVEGSQSDAEERTKEISTQAATAVSKELTDDVKSIISKVNAVLSLVDKDEDDSGWDLKSEQWNRVEEKVDKILTMQTQELATALADQGSSIRAVIDEVEERKTEISKKLKVNMLAVEKLIIPMLKGLMANPEREYIKWPNRGPIIQKQVDKILTLTRLEDK